MIKILFSSLTGFPNQITGGPNKIIDILASNLPKDIFSVEFVSKHGRFTFITQSKTNVNKKVDYLRQFFFNKSKFYRNIFTSSYYLRKFFTTSIDKITKLISESEFQILNAHDVRTLFGITIDKRIILSIHSKGSIVQDMIALYGEKKQLKDLFLNFYESEKQALNKVEQIIFPSNAARDLYFKDLNLEPSNYKTKVIYNSIDKDRIDAIKVGNKFLRKYSFLEDKKLKILNVANHIKVKNIDKILSVLKEFKKQEEDFIFINIGSGPLTNELISLKHKYNLKRNVIFIPILSNDDIIRMMKSCDIYISLSERVIFDMVVLEALACGMKIIASNDGGNKEVIQDNFNGYLVDINNKDKIIELLKNKEDNFIKTNAIETIDKFSIDNFIKEYIKVYEGKEY